MKILTHSDLKEVKGIRYSTHHLRRLEAASQFPRRVKLGEGFVGWVDQEIDDWLIAKAAARHQENDEDDEDDDDEGEGDDDPP